MSRAVQVLEEIQARRALPDGLTVIDAPPAPPPKRFGRRRSELVETILSHASEPTIELSLGADAIASVRLGATVVLIGASGRGKTSLATTIAVEHAQGRGPAIAMSLELPEDELAARAIGTRCDASWPEVLGGTLTRERMLQALPERFSVIERQHATLSALETEIDAMRKEYPVEPILVAVDYVQLVPGESEDEPRMRVDAAMRALDHIARSRRVVVLALSQGSRASAKALSSGELLGAQTTDAGAESAAIERWASLTLAIGEHGPEAEDGSCATSISIGKYRMGKGDVVLPARYHGRSGLWRLTGDAKPAAEVRAERQDARTEASIATLMLAVRGAVEQSATPLSDRQLGELVTGKAVLRRQARARLLADPDSGIVECGRQSGGRKPSYPVWTRTRAKAAGLPIHDGEADS
ncbi:MAG: DnaB-like helicase C-terminal domain-containing protein [Kofleriaceae bacterium]|nr:DnaB-like helicase C-terminal domain-containing protein [Kofleriaceae bacterium]